MTMYYCAECGTDYNGYSQYILYVNSKIDPKNPHDTYFEHMRLRCKDWDKFYTELTEQWSIWICSEKCLIRFVTHHRMTQELCYICKKNIAWEHIPYLEGVTFENYNNKQLVCFQCFHEIWAGEN